MASPDWCDVVVARHNEPLDWLPKLRWPVMVYTKTEWESDSATRPWVRDTIVLPNVGREAFAYLSHIVSRYDTLADVTVFVQADPYAHEPDMPDRIRDLAGWCRAHRLATTLTRRYRPHLPVPQVAAQDQVLNRAGHVVCYGMAEAMIENTGRRNTSRRNTGRSRPRPTLDWLDRIWAAHRTGPRPRPWRYGYAAHWAVPRETIRETPLSRWAWCRDQAAGACLGAGKDPTVAWHPHSPWSYEMIWGYLFNAFSAAGTRCVGEDRDRTPTTTETAP